MRPAKVQISYLGNLELEYKLQAINGAINI